MKTQGFGAACNAIVLAATAAAAFTAGGISLASAEQCTGPFRECAVTAGAICSRDPDGVQRMTYYDYPGRVMGFEQCVGHIFEAAGQRNPYTSLAGRNASSGGKLTVPRSYVIYPFLEKSR